MTKAQRSPLSADDKSIRRLQNAFDRAYESGNCMPVVQELRAVARAMGRPDLANSIKAGDPPFVTVNAVAKALGFKLALQKAA